MLRLKRRIGSRFFIEIAGCEPIIVTLLDTDPKYANIGIEAPKEMHIIREEIKNKPKRNP